MFREDTNHGMVSGNTYHGGQDDVLCGQEDGMWGHVPWHDVS